jgi:hypothetical protein
MQKVFNIVVIALFLGMAGILISRPEPIQPQPINYELFEYRFKELKSQIDSLQLELTKSDSAINQIKFKIITDENKIRNASNADIDSIFNAMVARQRKGRLQ